MRKTNNWSKNIQFSDVFREHSIYLSNKNTKFAAINSYSDIMAGIYIHVPFCASRCIYCDFYSTTSSAKAALFTEALLREIEERKDFLHEPIRTIYFGGGTPSQLPSAMVRKILVALDEHFDLSQCEEVTMEANPEDIAHDDYCIELLTQREYADEPLLSHPVNRISMGVQSMVDTELVMLRRRHNAATVCQAVERLRNGAIENISLDLMYGLPTQTLDSWKYSIAHLLELKPQHISAYNLSVEESTRLHLLVERGDLTPCDDETCLTMAKNLRDELKKAGYQQYEISNYALPGFHSRHNSSYWVKTPYLGLGPGAHSYDGKSLRIWNAPHLINYINGKRNEESEQLTPLDLYNERIMLGLRTSQGAPLMVFEAYRNETEPILQSLLSRQLVRTTCDHLILTEAGLALADEVIRELMLLPEE